jgi:prepilin-type N-terminal cleavage/methylation domain-containing protein
MSRRIHGLDRGLSLPELLVGIAVIGLLAGMAFHSGGDALERQRLEAAARRLEHGIDKARSEAQRQGQPCGLSLEVAGWGPPRSDQLPPCRRTLESLQEPLATQELQLSHNLPAALRFSANGLVLDGGTVVLSAARTQLRRCLVMALPLGVVRLGRYRGDPATGLSSTACEPDPSL